jgi:hypothetical protein
MDRMAKSAAVVVLAHALVAAVHGVAHLQVGVEVFPSVFHRVFILGVITLAPFLALALLWTPFRRAGVLVLLGSMAGSLLFGAFYHYLTPGPDHVSQIPSGAWGMVFHITAILLAVTEALGCCVGVWGLLRGTRR